MTDDITPAEIAEELKRIRALDYMQGSTPGAAGINPRSQRAQKRTARLAATEDAPATESESAAIPFDAIAVPSLADLQDKAIPARTWFFDEIIPAGAFLIVGRPKVGKSWLLLQLALAAARGADFLGYRNVDHD